MRNFCCFSLVSHPCNKTWRLRKVKSHNYSLVQVNGDYEAKEDHIKRYLSKVEQLKCMFEKIKIEYIFKPANKRVHALACLSSSTPIVLGTKIVIGASQALSLQAI